MAVTTGFDVHALEVLPIDECDSRLGLEPVPDLPSVEEAAAELGVSGQRVRQRLQDGSLDGRRFGGVWVVPASAVLGAI